MRVALIVEYEGTAYHGFQYQSNANSVQEELERAIYKFTGESVRIKGAGRTDKGVHAKMQVVAFDTSTTHDPRSFLGALNYHLPSDVAVKNVKLVEFDFDPRRMAKSRTYRFTIDNGLVQSPLTRRTAYHIPAPLDIKSMNNAAQHFIGIHDFHRFAGPLENPNASTVREVKHSSVKRNGHVLTYDVTAGSFLPHQVRRMAGTLVDIGLGKLTSKELKSMLSRENVGLVAQSLPPHGLCMMMVDYDNFVIEGNSSHEHN